MNENGMILDSPRIGPYKEGQIIKLLCQTLGGKPLPELTWFYNEQKMPSVQSISYRHNTLQNPEESFLPRGSDQSNHQLRTQEITLGPLTRSCQDMPVTCQASNSQFNSPRKKTFRIDMLREYCTCFIF